MKQDSMPLPYGALDYYQVHYIVETSDDVNTQKFLAKCEPITKGRFSEKRIIAVKWTGASAFANKLQQDQRLTELLKQALLHEREVRVDPLDGHVRIYGRWNHEENLKANDTMVEIADIIAGYIKASI